MARRNVTPRDRENLRKILRNKEARKEFQKQVNAKFGLKGQLGDGKILELLLEHADEILAIIAAILKMFAL